MINLIIEDIKEQIPWYYNISVDYVGRFKSEFVTMTIKIKPWISCGIIPNTATIINIWKDEDCDEEVYFVSKDVEKFIDITIFLHDWGKYIELC